MTGFRVFQYFIAIKLHFTKREFSVFKNKGFLRGSYEKFLARDDYQLFEFLAKKYVTDKEVIQVIASNILYGNNSVVYDINLTKEYYEEYLRRKQSITKIFTDDLYLLSDKDLFPNNTLHYSKNLLDLYLGKKITIESVSILNDFCDTILTSLYGTNIADIFQKELLRIEKSKGFIIYNKEKLLSIYNNYQQEEL